MIACRTDDSWGTQEVHSLDAEVGLIAIFGRIYDMKKFIHQHPGGVQGVARYLGSDASHLFARAPPITLPEACLDLTKTNYLNQHANPECPLADDNACHRSYPSLGLLDVAMRPFHRGFLTLRANDFQDGMQWIQIHNKIYNVTQYLDGLRENVDQLSDGPNHPNAFLFAPLHRFVVNFANQDGTEVFDKYFRRDVYEP